MKLGAFTRFLFLLALMTACRTILHADGIIGDIPFAGFLVSGPTNFTMAASMFDVGNAVTSGPGKGDFSTIPIMTSFGSFSLLPDAISTGGGFSIGNTPGAGR